MRSYMVKCIQINRIYLQWFLTLKCYLCMFWHIQKTRALDEFHIVYYPEN